MIMTVKKILDYLNEAQIRCTYGAFGELTGTPARWVAQQHQSNASGYEQLSR